MPGGDSDADRAEVRDHLAAAVREAGALALKTFRGQLKSWIKGKSSPVSEADLAVDALLRERLLDDPRCRLAVGGDARTIRRGLQRARGLGRRSDRRHTRLSRGLARLGDFGGAGARRPPGGRRALCAGDRRAVSVRCRRAARRSTACRSMPAPAMRSPAQGFPAQSAVSTAWPRSSREFRRRHAFHRLRCVLPASRSGALDGTFTAPQQPRLGPCGGRSFGARSRRGVDDLDGAIVDLQPARSGAWRAAGGRRAGMRRCLRSHSRSAGRIRVIDSSQRVIARGTEPCRVRMHSSNCFISSSAAS